MSSPGPYPQTSCPQKAAIYALLGRIFISELDRQSLEDLKQPAISSVFEKLQAGFQVYLENTRWDDRQIEQLSSDYCHLFILPQKSGLSLRASHWMAGEESNEMAQLESIISGLDFGDAARHAGFSHTPNDHLGVLLYFISSIYASEDAEIQKFGENIVQLALLPWIFRFNDKLLTATENPIYRASGKLLLELLYFENDSSLNALDNAPAA